MITPAAVGQLIEIATQNGRLRVDLLSLAAGTALGAWLDSKVSGWSGQRSASLLIDAGADPVYADEIAEATRIRLRLSSDPGIGNSRRRPATPPTTVDQKVSGEGT